MTKTSGQLEVERIRERNRIDIEDLSVCYFCNSTGLLETDFYCPNCAFPQGKEDAEKHKYIRAAAGKKKLLLKQIKAIKHGRVLLYILAVLNLVIGLIMGFAGNMELSIVVNLMLMSMVYIALAKWSEVQPFAAILSGLIVFIVAHIISAIHDPATIAQGFLIKILVVSAFVYGFKGVKDSGRLSAELNNMNTSKDMKLPE